MWWLPGYPRLYSIHIEMSDEPGRSAETQSSSQPRFHAPIIDFVSFLFMLYKCVSYLDPVGVAVGLVGGTDCVVVAPVVGVGVTPIPVVGATVGLVVGAVGLAAAAVLIIALIATPLASVVTVIGSGLFSKATQFSPSAP